MMDTHFLSQSLRIASWNIDYLPSTGKKANACRAKITEVQADIFVITETLEKFTLGEEYKCVAKSKPAKDLSGDKRWVMVWMKSSLVGVFEQIESSDPERTACAKVTIPDGLEIIIYGTVLPWLGSTWNDVSANDGKAFLSALKVQKDNWVSLREKYSNALLCVAGDLNQALLDTKYAYGSTAGREALQDALQEAKLGYHTGGKMDPVAANAHLNANIDHICLSAPANRLIESITTSAWSLVYDGSHISDHFGVYMDFKLH